MRGCSPTTAFQHRPTGPRFDYDCRGNLALTFAAVEGQPLLAQRSAERWLSDRGFSIGVVQGSEPRGVLYGSTPIPTWRSLGPKDRRVFDAVMVGSGQLGPVRVLFRHTASKRARSAIFVRQIPSENATHRVLTDLGMAAAVASFIGWLVYSALAPLPYATGGTSFDADQPKITMRAGAVGLRTAAQEARR